MDQLITTAKGMPRRAFLKYGLMSAAASLTAGDLLAACGSTSTSSGAKHADEVIYGQGGTETTINPLQTLGHSESYACWDALTYVDPTRDGAVFPKLATSWTRLDDVTMEFKLRQGVKFSDGSALTANDVKFSYDTTVSEKLAVFSEFSNLAEVNVIDPQTIHIVTKTADPLLERRASLLFIVPQAVYSRVGTSGFPQSAVGSGKYKVTSYTPGSLIKMEANPHSWAGQPVTPKFTWQMFAQPSAVMDALEGGQIDFTNFTGGSGVADQVAAFNTLSAQTGGPRQLRLNTTKPPFNNPLVRQAVQYAIDVATLCTTVNKGFGTPLPGQLPTAQCFGYDPTVKSVGFDQAKAKSLLAQAGYPNGFATSIASALNYHDLMVGISGYLQQVGITATVIDQSGTEFLDCFFNGTTLPMWMYAGNFSPLYDADLSFQWLTAPIPPAPGTRSWVNPQWDQMLNQERVELTTATRLSELQAMTAYANQQTPITYLDSQAFLYAWSKKVFDFNPATGFFFLADTMYKTA
jgi:peptide/nickel transport system substrate-binding protein